MCEVLVTGTFNILHSGHIELLEFASRFGNVTVGLNADDYLYKKYGKEKTMNLMKRSQVIKSIKYVDQVVVFREDDPSDLILKLKPRYLVKGPDYADKNLVESEAIAKAKTKLIFCRERKQCSATELASLLDELLFKD
jgi:rfaE bifunctional protein nucleotidyltransferase chain/domain